MPENRELLQSISDKLDKSTADLVSIKNETEAIKRWLVGDPDNPNTPGVLMRLDRIEQHNRLWSWVSGTALGAVIAYCANWVMSKFHGK